MRCKEYPDFEERGEICIINQILPAAILVFLSSFILLCLLIEISIGENLEMMLEFIENDVRIKEEWARWIAMFISAESMLSAILTSVFPFWICVRRIYVIKVPDNINEFFIPFFIGFMMGPIFNYHFIIREGDFLLAIVILIIVTFLAFLMLEALLMIGKIGRFFSGMNPVILEFIIAKIQICNDVFSYIPLLVYLILVSSLIYFRISIDSFWREFGEIYIRARGVITKDEIEHLFSVSLDRQSASYLSIIFEDMGLKVKAKYRENDIEIFIIKA